MTRPDNHNNTIPTLTNYQTRTINAEVSELFINPGDGPSYVCIELPDDIVAQMDRYWPMRTVGGVRTIKAKICVGHGSRSIDTVFVGNIYNMVIKSQTYIVGEREYTQLYVYVCECVGLFVGKLELTVSSRRGISEDPLDM